MEPLHELVARAEEPVVQAVDTPPGTDLTELAKVGAVVPDVLDRVGLASRKHHWPHQLSGGEQQRVAIARALVNDPALILADEPTGALDRRTSDEILSLLEELHRDARTIVVVTHAPHVAERTHRRIILDDGFIVADDAAMFADSPPVIPAAGMRR